MAAWLLVLCTVGGAVRLSAENSWIPIGPEGGPVACVFPHPAQTQVLYLATGSTPSDLYRSTNKGSSWSRQGGLTRDIYCMIINRKTPNEIYAGAYGEFLKSTDSGATWKSTSLSNACMRELSQDSLNAKNLHACGYSYNADTKVYVLSYYKSTDLGATWSTKTCANEQSYGYTVSVDPRNPKTVIVGGYVLRSDYGPILCKTTNGGDTWSDITGTVTGYVYDVLMDSASVKRIFACTGTGVYRSTDMGASWTKNDDWVSGMKICQDPKNKNGLYVGGNGTVFQSTNGGANWSVYTNGLAEATTVNDICVDPALSSTVYLGAKGGFFKSTDSGKNWNCIESGIVATYVTMVKTMPSNPSVVYAAHESGYLFRTGNGLAKGNKTDAVVWEKIAQVPNCDSYGVKSILFGPAGSNKMQFYKAYG
jgi:photosystem II stability/assembly factor-like uncharacterized protein